MGLAKTSGLVKNSSAVSKRSSPRDSQADLDTMLVQDSEEVAKARAAMETAESVSSYTETADCHPVILDDLEDDTDRFDDPPARSGPVARQLAVEPTHKKDVRFDDVTEPMPKPNIGAIGGALETVPLTAGLVQHVVAQVDARAAARTAGAPVHPYVVVPMPSHASAQRSVPAPRRIGVEIFITVLAFLAVAAPALYYLYGRFMKQ
jgi:hypothetical protein